MPIPLPLAVLPDRPAPLDELPVPFLVNDELLLKVDRPPLALDPDDALFFTPPVFAFDFVKLLPVPLFFWA
jgi:hypothetical protein